MTTNFDDLCNRIGALALRLSDQIEVAVTDGGARSLSSATALSALDRFLDAPTIGQLSDVLGLSSSATVRLVDALAADGRVVRSAADDGRSSTVQLTRSGRRTAKRIVAARSDVLANAMAPLDDDSRTTLAPLVEKVLIGLVAADTNTGWMCRLCDTETCGAAPGEPCPITQAALRLADDTIRKGSYR